MAETCVLGHAWTPGRVLCAECGFGPRALQPGQTTTAATQAAVTSEPELAVAGAHARMGRSLQLEEPAAVATPVVPAEPELTLSPDGQWAWNGTEWVPAPPQPEPAPQADLIPEPAPRRSRRRRRSEPVAEPAAVDGVTDLTASAPQAKAARRTADPKLLILLVLVLAIAAAADFALKLPPLGHKAATTSSAPVVSASQTLAHETAFDRAVLKQGATAEKAYRTKSGLYTSSVAQLRKDGMPAVLAPAVFAAQAHHGTGFCLVAGTGRHFSLYDSVKGGVRPTSYTTEVLAMKGCSQKS